MKTAIVTGVAGGIGLATAKILNENGFAIVGMDIPPFDSVKDKFSDLDKNFTYIPCDLSDLNSHKEIVKTAVETYGGIDVLVNVAGVAPKVRADLLEMSEESYDFVMNINTKGTLFFTQAVANQMLKQEAEDGVRGYIVNISSCSAYTSSTSRGEYCISKAGVSMITMLFADRLAGDGILVNEICPGVIMTGMTEVVKAKYDKLISEGLVPTNRWGQPEDVAKAVLALSNGTLGYTTGQSISVDGGMHIRKL